MGAMRNLVVRTAGVGDLQPLTSALGDNGHFPDWLHRQRAGRGELLVALVSGRHVGTVYLWLEDADELPIRRHLPGVPLLRHLRVSGPYRRRSIGTKLIAVAEHRLRDTGHDRVAIAVDVHNTEAIRLYTRLGYHDWGHGTVECHPIDAELGEMELCAVLVKPLLNGVS